MRIPDRDLARVASVRIEHGGRTHQLADCWICIRQDTGLVEIWLGREDNAPLVVLKLEDVLIEWPVLEALL